MTGTPAPAALAEHSGAGAQCFNININRDVRTAPIKQTYTLMLTIYLGRYSRVCGEFQSRSIWPETMVEVLLL
jgi:hypothetical protein